MVAFFAPYLARWNERKACFWDFGMTVREYPAGEDSERIFDFRIMPENLEYYAAVV